MAQPRSPIDMPGLRYRRLTDLPNADDSSASGESDL
jgi:hypothetical protein